MKWPWSNPLAIDKDAAETLAEEPTQPKPSVDLVPVVHEPQDTPKPVVIKRSDGCLPEIPQVFPAAPRTKAVHQHARLEVYEPSETVDHRGTIRTDH